MFAMLYAGACARVSNALSCGGRLTRVVRLLLLLVLALAAVKYHFGSILDASPLKTYLYTPLYNVIQTNNRIAEDPTQTCHHHYYAKPLCSTERNTTAKLSKTNNTLCHLPPDLGPVAVNKTIVELDSVEKKFPEVGFGGRYIPSNCTASHKVAVIVPFRDRQQHLAIFLNHMHPFLMKQQIEYGIFIIEQEGNKQFNRAKLMNVGFMESQRLEACGWQCFVFHDIDLLPLDTRNLYSCPEQPRHMSAAIDLFKFKLPYEEIFGGVSAMTLEQFARVNGFSNNYWGWGGEDDDMFYRLKEMNYKIERYEMEIARYTMLVHRKSKPNPNRHVLLSQTSQSFLNDGLSSLEYKLVRVTESHLYTHIVVNIDYIS